MSDVVCFSHNFINRNLNTNKCDPLVLNSGWISLNATGTLQCSPVSTYDISQNSPCSEVEILTDSYGYNLRSNVETKFALLDMLGREVVNQIGHSIRIERSKLRGPMIICILNSVCRTSKIILP